MTSDRRKEAHAALSKAARLWLDAGGLAGDPLARAVAHVLNELNVAARTGDLAALEAKGGPARWAAAYEKGRSDPDASRLFASAADAARDFLRTVDLWTRADPAAFAREDRARHLAEVARGWLQISGVRNGLVLMVPADADLREAQLVAMTACIRTVARRKAPDAKAFGVAMLEGWGMDKAAARNALKDKDT